MSSSHRLETDTHREHKQGFIRRYVFSTDHKIIGIQYFLTGGLMGLLGASLAALIRLQLAWPGRQWEWLGALFPVGMESGVMKPTRPPVSSTST